MRSRGILGERELSLDFDFADESELSFRDSLPIIFVRTVAKWPSPLWVWG